MISFGNALLFFITITDEREFFESSQTWTSCRRFYAASSRRVSFAT